MSLESRNTSANFKDWPVPIRAEIAKGKKTEFYLCLLKCFNIIHLYYTPIHAFYYGLY